MSRKIENSARSQLFCATAILASIWSSAALAQAGSPASQASPAYGDQDPEIIVTAQRREERAQDVPISLTAFSPQRLQQQNITQAQDLQASVPSLVVGSGGNSNRESQIFTIRGQGSTFQSSPGVVVYLNEVPLPAAFSANQQGGAGNFVDLENLQVLNGPQGTLFGRNTTGGAVLLVPHKPTNEFEGYVDAKLGNYDNRQFEGAINVPVVDDKVLLRVAGAYQDRDGYTRDVVWNKDRDNLHWYSGRVGLTLRPSERFENYTMLYGSNSKNNGVGLIHRGYNIDALAGFGLCYEGPTIPGAIASCDVYRAATANAEALGPRQTAFSVDTFSRTKTWGVSNTSTFDVSDEITLRNIVSYQRYRTIYSADPDATVLQAEDDNASVLPAPGQVTLPGDGTPLVYENAISGRPLDDFRQITEELQLQGSFFDKRLEVTVGGFFFDQRPSSLQEVRYVVFCPAAFTGFCPVGVTGYSVKNSSKALYAQATIDLGLATPALEGLKLTGGIRNTWDKVTGAGYGYGASTDPADPVGTIRCSLNPSIDVIDPVQDCAYGATLKTSRPTWTVGVDYRVSPDLMVYAKVSRGYKAGGFNSGAVFANTATFSPETVTSYEAGFKSDFRVANMPTRLNAAYYYLDYANIQRASGDFNPDTNGVGSRVLGAEARIQGVEVDASIRPIKGVEIGGTFSYTDAKYTKYEAPVNVAVADCSGGVIPVGGTASFKCLPFQFVAPYIYSFHVSAEQPIGGNLGTLAMFVNYSHTSSQHSSPSIGEPNEKLEPYGTLNLSIDWRKIAGSGLDVGFYATNLTNKLYRVGNANTFNSLLFTNSLYGEPRMYGARARYAF
ncbi:TonB-dependent receptor [Sphingobium vermicomposti]|uniref:Iron complex outermembrane receptor protein n=1 Tax=Sphingobium vermicomposti TaxID=529005 RepID=A0A846MH14_9SPHN|nr:TonB-dependent receptor [Sphingobium vermicomposti]NIJ17895.1 iron complex outermembrane receptor protein [Sphingobium vermicomposti]